MKNSKLVLIAALFAGQALTFWEQGHLYVARIAYDILSQESPEALTAANSMLETFKKSDPSLTKLEGSYPFVECATFADEIKAKGGAWQSGWHFIDTPFLDEGGSVQDYPEFVFDKNNVGAAIPDIVAWLSNQGDYQSSFVYTTIKQNVPDEDNAKSYALRLLIHYMGDIHQPLHATSRLDKKYPKGDAGGNFFKVPSEDEATNLHAVWDAVVYLLPSTPSLPYNANDWSTFGNNAATMVSSYPVTPDEYENTNVNDWAKESYQLSVSNVYTGIKENEKLPEEYVKTNQDAIQKQIVRGGYRLATMMKGIFGNSQVEINTTEESFLQ